jgi:hypothetical protein
MSEQDQVVKLAEEIFWLTADQIWELAKRLNDNYPVQATILREDLDTVE